MSDHSNGCTITIEVLKAFKQRAGVLVFEFGIARVVGRGVLERVGRGGFPTRDGAAEQRRRRVRTSMPWRLRCSEMAWSSMQLSVSARFVLLR